MSDPDRLRDLGKRLDELQTRRATAAKGPAPTMTGAAFRLATELVAALIVGGGLGWGIDWLTARAGFHTRPAFMIVFVLLGAAAGIRNVVRAAQELNAASSASAAKGSRETGEK